MNKELQMFAMDLGVILGAKSQEEAIQKGADFMQSIGEEQTTQLIQIWGQAEQKQKGSGKKALYDVLSKSQQKQQQQGLFAKMGAKLTGLSRLNGKCPEGYEVVSYANGGCVKCQKKKEELLKCGGKKRFKKNQDGGIVKESDKMHYKVTEPTKKGKRVTVGEYSDDPNGWAQADINGKDTTMVRGTLEKFRELDVLKKTANKNTVKKNQQGGLFEAFKCGGKKRITKKCAKGQPVELDKCGKKMKKKQAGGTMDYSWLRHQSNQ